MIYIQNIYVNQQRKEQYLKFPFFAKEVDFANDFELKFNELWHTLYLKVANENNEMQVFYEENQLFYENLFQVGSNNEKLYTEIVKSFEVWWSSFAGGFALERSIDGVGQQLYNEVVSILKKNKINPSKHLQISLIYDDCIFAQEMSSSYFAVVPAKDFLIAYKEVVTQLKKCFIEA